MNIILIYNIYNNTLINLFTFFFLSSYFVTFIMNINYNYYNKQILINQLIEQIKFNLARLTNLENIVNKLISDASVITLDKALDKAVNGYKLFKNVTEIISNTKFNYLLNINNLFNGNIFLDNEQYTKIILPNATFRNVITNITDLTDRTTSNSNDTLIELDLSSVTFDEITRCEYIFEQYSKIEKFNLHSATFSKVSNSNSVIHYCPKLKNIDLSSATFENLYMIQYIFDNCPMLEIVNLPNATFKNDTLWRIEDFITNCDNLKYVNIPKAKFNNKDLNSISSFVINCKSLETVILSSATFENITRCNIFNNCPKLMIINMPNATFKNVTNFSGSFNNCPS